MILRKDNVKHKHNNQYDAIIKLDLKSEKLQHSRET